MALDYLLQVGEFLGEVPFQPVVIHEGIGVGQLSAWRARGEENEGLFQDSSLGIRDSLCLPVSTH